MALPSDTPSLVVCFAPTSQATSTRVSWLITGGGGLAWTDFFPKAACPLPPMTECPDPVQQILEGVVHVWGFYSGSHAVSMPSLCGLFLPRSPAPPGRGCHPYLGQGLGRLATHLSQAVESRVLFLFRLQCAFSQRNINRNCKTQKTDFDPQKSTAMLQQRLKGGLFCLINKTFCSGRSTSWLCIMFCQPLSTLEI